VVAIQIGMYSSERRVSSEGRVGDALFDVEDMTGTDGGTGALSAGWTDGASLGVIIWQIGCRQSAVGEGRRGGPRQDPG